MRSFIMAFAILIWGCGHIPVPPVIIEPDDTEQCAAACIHLRNLGCEEGQDLEDGTTCTKFCVDTQVSGHALSPSCVLTISSCEELEPKCAKPRQLLD